jgi:hypothetical protein
MVFTATLLVDAPALFLAGQFYNGRSSNLVTSREGA